MRIHRKYLNTWSRHTWVSILCVTPPPQQPNTTNIRHVYLLGSMPQCGKLKIRLFWNTWFPHCYKTALACSDSRKITFSVSMFWSCFFALRSTSPYTLGISILWLFVLHIIATHWGYYYYYKLHFSWKQSTIKCCIFFSLALICEKYPTAWQMPLTLYHCEEKRLTVQWLWNNDTIDI